MGPLHKQKWDDPLSSVGDYRGMIEIKAVGMFKDKKCCWEAKDGSPASAALKRLVPKINELLEASDNRMPDSAMILMDIFMFGDVAEESIPYIMFSCPNTYKRARIKAMNLVRRSGLLKEFPGLKVFHWEFPPHIPDPELAIEPRIRLNITMPGGSEDIQETSFDNPSGRQALEIYLIATLDGKVDASASQKSTVGAIVRFGKCVLYLTAAHILLPGCENTNRRRSRVGDLNDLDEYASDYFSEDDSAYEFEDDDESVESFRIGPQSSSSTPPGQGMAIRELDSPCQSPSQNSGTELLDTPTQLEENSVVLQSSRGPHFANGEVFFKSHELDFALLDLSDFDIPPCDIPELTPDAVSEIRAGSTKVVARVASRRDLRGQMSGRPSYIRFPHGGSYQEVYPVYFSGDIQIGDSGTFVQDSKTGKIYGHIVVASIASRTAFIVPATKVLQSIPWLTPAASGMQKRLKRNSGPFRFVRLLPSSSPGDAICCEHFLTRLENQPKFEALSYVWEVQEKYRPIFLNGQPWNVRPALAAALRRLRHADTERYLWIDALCINQTNRLDKLDHLRLVDYMFGRSDRCLVWLGDVYEEGTSSSIAWTFSFTQPSMDHPPPASSPNAISQEDALLAFGLLTQFEPKDNHTEGAIADDNMPFVTSESQQALNNLMALPGWKQFWLFQHARCTPCATFICGTMSMDLDLFGGHAMTLRKFPRRNAQGRRDDGLDFDILLRFLRIVGRLQSLRPGPENFTFAMNAIRDLVCLDPRDKVFALQLRFGGVDPTHGMNYSNSIDQIYEATTIHQLLSTKSLLPLARMTEVGRNPSFPSWVPDWSASIESEPQFHSELSFLMSWGIFNADLGEEPFISIYDHTLCVEGLLIDRVSTTYSIMEPGIDLSGLMVNFASQIGGDPTSQSTKLIGKEKTNQAIQATPLRSRTQGWHSEDFWRLLTNDIRISEFDEVGLRRAHESDREACLREYQNGLLGHGVRGRRSFSTETKYFGLGPAEMKVGDVVVVLFGGRFPFILRPTAGHFYNLVGYAYVSGIMDGEAISEIQETETFEIV